MFPSPLPMSLPSALGPSTPTAATATSSFSSTGLDDNRMGMTGYAQLLLAHGSSVLLPDARAHGASGGNLATYGLLERYDIRQWLGFLLAHVHPHCIFGLAE